MRGLVLAFALAISAVLATPANATEKPVIVVFPVAGETFTNTCNGETVTLVSGRFQIVTHTTLDSSGGFHMIVEGNAKSAAAVAPSGNYRVTGGFWFEVNTGPDRAANVTVTGVLNLISQGSTDNFAEETVFHVTTNANGVPTSFVMGTADSICRG